MIFSDWQVIGEVNEKESCIRVTINKDIEIKDLKLSLIDEERKLITRMDVNSHEIYFCISIGNLIFAQLGDSVKYVSGSGDDSYKKPNKKLSVFLQELKELDKEETKFKALDSLYKLVDEYLDAENYKQCDKFITEFIKINFTKRLYYGLLVSTSRRKSYLKERKKAFELYQILTKVYYEKMEYSDEQINKIIKSTENLL